MKWIVTGGAGFIGSNAVRTLVARGAEVVVVDSLVRPSAPLNLGWLREKAGTFTFVRVDVRDRATLEPVFRDNPDADVVLHLAGQVAVTTSVADPGEDLQVNVVGSFNALDLARTYLPECLFINASTNKVYGALSDHRVEERGNRFVDVDFPRGIPERHPLDPHSPYGCSKAAAESYVLDYARTYGLRTVSFRQSCVYGPRQFGVEDQGWVAWLALGAALGLPLTVYGSGKQVRDLLHVGDLVELYLLAAERRDECAGRTYNAGGGPENTLSVLELLERLGRHEAAFAAERQGDQKVFVADASRAHAELGWSPTVGVEAGLAELLDWVESNREAAKAILPTP